MLPQTYNLTIRQGATFNALAYFYDGVQVVKAITAIGAAFPPVLTASAHGLPADEIPVRLIGIKGPTELNTSTDSSDDNYLVHAQRITTDTFSLPEADAAPSALYKGGGYLAYTPPKDITGWSARMQVRPSVDDTTVLLALSDTDGTLVLGGTEGSVEIVLEATATAALDFDTAVYDLELVDPTGTVVSLVTGTVTLSKEITRN